LRLDPQVLWFCGVVKAMEQAERALLLKFATGSSRVPPGGFAALYGLTGPTKFTLARVEVSMDSSAGAAAGPLSARDAERSLLLPTASACFNMLELPAYACFEVLEKKLLTAVGCGAGGFAFRLIAFGSSLMSGGGGGSGGGVRDRAASWWEGIAPLTGRRSRVSTTLASDGAPPLPPKPSGNCAKIIMNAIK
jgi:hypothetical protein